LILAKKVSGDNNLTENLCYIQYNKCAPKTSYQKTYPKSSYYLVFGIRHYPKTTTKLKIGFGIKPYNHNFAKFWDKTVEL